MLMVGHLLAILNSGTTDVRCADNIYIYLYFHMFLYRRPSQQGDGRPARYGHDDPRLVVS